MLLSPYMHVTNKQIKLKRMLMYAEYNLNVCFLGREIINVVVVAFVLHISTLNVVLMH